MDICDLFTPLWVYIHPFNFIVGSGLIIICILLIFEIRRFWKKPQE